MYGENLKKARKKKGLTLQEVADLMKTTHTTISRYENNKRSMNEETIKTFCEIYNISADYILGLPKGLNYPDD